MTLPDWIPATAWGWFAVLALLGQLRPSAQHVPPTSASRIVTNVLLGASDLAIGLVLPAAVILAAWLGNRAEFGLLRLVALPGWVQIVLAFVLGDLLLWAIHRLAHGWPPLWRLHRIHHCDTTLDVLTSYRQHPLASLAAGWLQALGVVLLGLDPLGVAAYQLVLAFHIPLHHAQVDWRLPASVVRAARWIFVTPGQHALHHSPRQAETDSNYGEVFALWDRIAGTLRHDSVGEPAFGLGPAYAGVADRIGGQLGLPFMPLDGPLAVPLRSSN